MLATDRLKSLKGQLEYVNDTLKNPLAKWERNEYLTLKSDYEKEIAELEAHIFKHQPLFQVNH